MASFQSHCLRHMTAQQGPNLTLLTFLRQETYISSTGWGPLGVVLSHRKSYIITAFAKNCRSFSMCWRICPNNTAKDNRDYKGIKKLHLETDINSVLLLWRPQKLFTWTWQQFFHNSVSLSTTIFNFRFVLAIMKLCKSSKKISSLFFQKSQLSFTKYLDERNVYLQNICSSPFQKPFASMVSCCSQFCILSDYLPQGRPSNVRKTALNTYSNANHTNELCEEQTAVLCSLD